MLQKYNRYRILEEFMDFPTKEFQIREISRRTKISLPSVINHLNELIKENLVIKVKKGIYPIFKANRENNLFKIYKRNNLILKMSKIGFLDYINDSCLPDSIILFGSSARGEDIESSDIDLFIQSKEIKLSLEKYEKPLNHKINLFFEENFNRLSSELKNNIINGIIVLGYLKVF